MAENSCISPLLTWQETYSLEKKQQSCFTDARCCFSFDTLRVCWLLNRGNLFLLIGSVRLLVLSSSRSFTKSLYCSFHTLLVWFTVSIISLSTISCVPIPRRSDESSMNGFPMSSNVSHKGLTCFLYVVCTPCWASRCLWCDWFSACTRSPCRQHSFEVIHNSSHFWPNHHSSLELCTVFS